MTINKIRFHHYDPEIKHQSMEYHVQAYGAGIGNQNSDFDRNLLVTVIWDVDSITHMDFLEPYIKITLQHSKPLNNN